jgi:DNA-directed RNA polymerase specialized sigma24 family protein
MKPRELTQDDLQQLFASTTDEEREEVRAQMQEIASRYADLPREMAVRLRQRDLSDLVMREIARVLGGSVKPQ